MKNNIVIILVQIWVFLNEALHDLSRIQTQSALHTAATKAWHEKIIKDNSCTSEENIYYKNNLTVFSTSKKTVKCCSIAIPYIQIPQCQAICTFDWSFFRENNNISKREIVESWTFRFRWLGIESRRERDSWNLQSCAGQRARLSGQSYFCDR